MRWRKRRKWSCNLQNKVEFRKDLLAKRATISVEERASAAQAALDLFISSSLFSTSQHIACYFAQDKEFDCALLIKTIWYTNKKCYLPVLSSHQENSLEFVSYHENDSLHFNRYKILEPNKEERVSPLELDLVLLPLVGFDLNGHRLGMGGGYYDKTFSFLREKEIKKPYLLGLAYELQQVSVLSNDPWDVRLNGVLTEKNIYYF